MKPTSDAFVGSLVANAQGPLLATNRASTIVAPGTPATNAELVAFAARNRFAFVAPKRHLLAGALCASVMLLSLAIFASFVGVTRRNSVPRSALIANRSK